MLPNSKIVISPNGDSKIEGLEKSPQCHKLAELAKSAGKVTEQHDKEHPPAQQHIQRKGI